MMNLLAIDLGAESGRVMLGTLEGSRLLLGELHRFETGTLPLHGALRVNLPGIYSSVRQGLQLAGARGVPVAGVSTDSWGVDYVLLRRGVPFLPYHYRDGRVDASGAPVFARLSREALYAATGIQFMPINTLFQIEHDFREDPGLFAAADSCLGIADAMNTLLGGAPHAEESLASTTQLYDPVQRAWSPQVLEAVGLPRALFPQIVAAGTVLGPLEPGLAVECGLVGAQVIATCSHDTGAAVAATPAEGEGWAYLSSGTWSLLGVERKEPLLSDACREANFTNEAGYAGTTRLLKNLAGMWLLQECRRAWAAAGEVYDYAALAEAAAASEPLRSLINPNDPRFASAGGMPEKIRAACRENGEPEPRTVGEVARCILESLALLYRATLAEAEGLTGEPIRKLHVVGGGSRNRYLNQWSADATGLPVYAGPAEATAIGNLLIQAAALGVLDSPEAIRRVVRESFPPEIFTPQASARPAWEAAAARFTQLL